MEKAIYTWALIAPQNLMAIHPPSGERGMLAFSRQSSKAKGEEPRASARGFFQRKSQYDSKATSVQNYTAIPPRSSERGILAFSRER